MRITMWQFVLLVMLLQMERYRSKPSVRTARLFVNVLPSVSTKISLNNAWVCLCAKIVVMAMPVSRTPHWQALWNALSKLQTTINYYFSWLFLRCCQGCGKKSDHGKLIYNTGRFIFSRYYQVCLSKRFVWNCSSCQSVLVNDKLSEVKALKEKMLGFWHWFPPWSCMSWPYPLYVSLIRCPQSAQFLRSSVNNSDSLVVLMDFLLWCL